MKGPLRAKITTIAQTALRWLPPRPRCQCCLRWCGGPGPRRDKNDHFRKASHQAPSTLKSGARGGSRRPSAASPRWSLFSHAMEWKTHEQSLQDIGGAGGYSQRRPSDGRYFRAQRTLHPSSALGEQPSPWPSLLSSTPWQITVIMRGQSQPVRESVHNYDLRGGLAPPGALPLLFSRNTPQIPLITWGP